VAFRSYPIRVGGPSGPMGRELSWETIAERSGVDLDLLKASEHGSVSGKQRRVSEFSWRQFRASIRLNGATDVALTFADYIDARNAQAHRFEQLTPETQEFVAALEAVSRVPVSLISCRFDGSVVDRRKW
jgi:adenylosuccinate synthase